MLKLGASAVLLTVAAWGASGSVPPPGASQELVQYVKTARGLGMKDDQIRQAALSAGWKSPAIEATLTAPRQPVGAADADSAPGPTPPEVNPEEYKIGPGDTLQVMVWKEPEASVPSVVVRPDGKIAMPLLKEIAVAGMTPRQAKHSIGRKLAEYIAAADVTVVVARIESKKIYVIGAVKKEGAMPLPYRMSVLQAISEAGGLSEYARRKKIYVLRSADGKQYRFPFNYDQVIKGEQPEQNIWVVPGDTIVVPR